MQPTGEQDIGDRALQTVRRLAADLERDASELTALPQGQAAAQSAAESARRVAKELQSVQREDAK